MKRALAAVFLFTSVAHAEMHIVKGPRWITEGRINAIRFHAVERCVGLTAPLPRIARTNPKPCPWDETYTCLDDESFGGFYRIEDQAIVLALGHYEVMAHEMIHHLKWIAQGDLSHDGPEWRCADMELP